MDKTGGRTPDDRPSDGHDAGTPNTDDAEGAIPEVLDRIEEAGTGERVTLGEMTQSVGARAFGPMLVIPGLISWLPPPGVGIIAGVLAILVAVQMVILPDRVWIPGFLARRSVSRLSLERFISRLEPWGRRLDRVIRPRLGLLCRAPFLYLVAAVVIAMGGLMFPLSLFFYAVAAPGLVLIVIGLALTVGDGAALVLGVALAAGAGALTWWLL